MPIWPEKPGNLALSVYNYTGSVQIMYSQHTLCLYYIITKNYISSIAQKATENLSEIKGLTNIYNYDIDNSHHLYPCPVWICS